MSKKTTEELTEIYRDDVLSQNDEISKMDLPEEMTHIGRRKIPR